MLFDFYVLYSIMKGFQDLRSKIIKLFCVYQSSELC